MCLVSNVCLLIESMSMLVWTKMCLKFLSKSAKIRKELDIFRCKIASNVLDLKVPWSVV